MCVAAELVPTRMALSDFPLYNTRFELHNIFLKAKFHVRQVILYVTVARLSDPMLKYFTNILQLYCLALAHRVLFLLRHCGADLTNSLHQIRVLS